MVFDVAVVGAGPAGIAATAAAAAAGARVVLLDEAPRAGGQIWRHREESLPPAARPWLERLARSGAELRFGASVVDAERSGAGFRLLVQSSDAAAGAPVEAHRLVIATGAREIFLPFPGWTLPNVLGVGGAQALLKSGMSVSGKSVVVAGSGPLLLPVSAALARAGARVRLIAEQAPRPRLVRFAGGLWRDPRKLAQAAGYRLAGWRAPYRTGSWVRRALGSTRVEAVEASVGGRVSIIPCDLLCTGFGLVPNLALARLVGCEVAQGVVGVDERQRTSVDGVWCAGEGTGVAGVEAALAEGSIAGFASADAPGRAARHLRERDRARRFAARLRETFAPREELRGLAEEGTVVCRCEDVARGALREEWTGRQAKLYTRLGMGPCQGRVCGPAAGYLFGWELEASRGPISAATVDTLTRGGEP